MKRMPPVRGKRKNVLNWMLYFDKQEILALKYGDNNPLKESNVDRITDQIAFDEYLENREW